MITLELTQGELDVLKILIKKDGIRTAHFATLFSEECVVGPSSPICPKCPNVASLEEKLSKM